MKLKHYFIVVIFTALGLLFFLYGFSFCFTRFFYNISAALILGLIFYLVDNKIIKNYFETKNIDLIKMMIVYFFSIFITSYSFLYLLKIAFSFLDFNQLSFYSVDNFFEGSLGLSIFITPVHFLISLYQERIELEKLNKELLINKERDRLAGELHDDIGFNLTTAVVQLNLAQKLIENERIDCSLDSISMARGQLKYALENIRLKVRLIEDDLNYKDEFNSLIENFKKLANINIDFEIDDLINIDDKYKMLVYFALKEGVNNGIRHGNATYFNFRLIIDKNEMLFFLKNNGKNDFNKIKKGFGLRNMENKVEQTGGRLKTYIDHDGYFILKFLINLD